MNDTDNITITCDIEADPSADVTWLFNGELLIQENIKYDFNGNNSKLTISSIRYTDNGVYTCTGSNVFGSVNDTMILSVQGESWTDNGVYTCTVSNVFGSVNDTMILSVQGESWTDNGVYTCTGSNVFGSVNDTMILSVQGESWIHC